jgi:hypothetical protein
MLYRRYRASAMRASSLSVTLSHIMLTRMGFSLAIVLGACFFILFGLKDLLKARSKIGSIFVLYVEEIFLRSFRPYCSKT